MFFCDKCANENKWPKSIGRSMGACEICGKVDVCNDIPCKYLPMPVKAAKKRAKK